MNLFRRCYWCGQRGGLAKGSYSPPGEKRRKPICVGCLQARFTRAP